MPAPPNGVGYHVTTDAPAGSVRSRVPVRAPELVGRRWLNTGGAELDLQGLRGRVVVLDFWTFCCVNCLHVLDELRPVEAQFPDELVLIGGALAEVRARGRPGRRRGSSGAVCRAAPGARRPGADDVEGLHRAGLADARRPRPEGYVVASMSGEGHGPGLAALIGELIGEHRGKGTLRMGGVPYVSPAPRKSALAFPGKVVALSDGSVIVSDTEHHHVVHLESDLETERARWGSADVFDEPQGLLPLPEGVATERGYDLLFADSVNHQTSSIRFSDGAIRVVAGTGAPRRRRSGGGPALEQDLSTPWDLAWWGDRVVIAMAGNHQLWELHLPAKPEAATVAVLAGTTLEGLRDGVAAEGWLAQPSGLAASADGSRVWVADAETSALRSISGGRTGFELRTHVGAGLFDFGHRDGAADQALLQHRSASPSCRTDRSPSATPSTAPSGASTPQRVSSRHWPLVSRSRATRWSSTSRPSTASREVCRTARTAARAATRAAARRVYSSSSRGRTDSSGSRCRSRRSGSTAPPGAPSARRRSCLPAASSSRWPSPRLQGRSSTTGGATPLASWCPPARRSCSSREPGRRRA